MNIGGNRHSEGGTPLNVPKGAFIFSDTAKMKIGGEILEQFGKPKDTKKKYTPAQLAKQYDLNKFTDKLKDENIDKIDKDTAELVVHNYKSKLASLAFTQEAMKDFPNGIPGITDQLLEEEQPEMAYGGLVKAETGLFNPPNKLGKHYADYLATTDPMTGKKSKTWNAMTDYSGSQEYADKVGYTGKLDLSSSAAIKRTNQMIQQHVMKTNPDLVAKWHNKDAYGMPLAGKPDDGNLGVRWSHIADEMNRGIKGVYGKQELIPPTRSFAPGITPAPAFKYPELPPLVPKPGDKPTPPAGPKTGNADFNNTPDRGVGPNMWDKIGVLKAMTRPIDHIRPQLFRTDAQVSDPSLIDNRAQIQQLQSVAASNNEMIENTASGQVGRANVMGNMSKLFDPINQSNMSMENTNIGTINQWKQNRDAVQNQVNQTNMGLLSKFTDENNMYKANLTKEKQLKFNDVVTQGQNMTNNMITLGSILEKTPNMTVAKNTWMPMFGRGSSLGPAGHDEKDNSAQMMKEYNDLIKGGMDKDIAYKFALMKYGKTVKTKDKNADGTNDETTTTTN